MAERDENFRNSLMRGNSDSEFKQKEPQNSKQPNFDNALGIRFRTMFAAKFKNEIASSAPRKSQSKTSSASTLEPEKNSGIEMRFRNAMQQELDKLKGLDHTKETEKVYSLEDFNRLGKFIRIPKKLMNDLYGHKIMKMEFRKLSIDKNAWIGFSEKLSDNKEIKPVEVFTFKIKTVLNKITARNYKSCFETIRSLEFKNMEFVDVFVDNIFSKGISEKSYCFIYSKLIVDVIEFMKINFSIDCVIHFKQLLLEKIKNALKRDYKIEGDLTNLKNTKISHQDEADILISKVVEQENIYRGKLFGNIILIGHLYFLNYFDQEFMDKIYEDISAYKDDFGACIQCCLIQQVGDVYLKKKNLALTITKSVNYLKDCVERKVYVGRTRYLILDLYTAYNDKFVEQTERNGIELLDQKMQYNVTNPQDVVKKDFKINVGNSKQPQQNQRQSQQNRSPAYGYARKDNSSSGSVYTGNNRGRFQDRGYSTNYRGGQNRGMQIQQKSSRPVLGKNLKTFVNRNEDFNCEEMDPRTVQPKPKKIENNVPVEKAVVVPELVLDKDETEAAKQLCVYLHECANLDEFMTVFKNCRYKDDPRILLKHGLVYFGDVSSGHNLLGFVLDLILNTDNLEVFETSLKEYLEDLVLIAMDEPIRWEYFFDSLFPLFVSGRYTVVQYLELTKTLSSPEEYPMVLYMYLNKFGKKYSLFDSIIASYPLYKLNSEIFKQRKIDYIKEIEQYDQDGHVNWLDLFFSSNESDDKLIKLQKNYFKTNANLIHQLNLYVTLRMNKGQDFHSHLNKIFKKRNLSTFGLDCCEMIRNFVNVNKSIKITLKNSLVIYGKTLFNNKHITENQINELKNEFVEDEKYSAELFLVLKKS